MAYTPNTWYLAVCVDAYPYIKTTQAPMNCSSPVSVAYRHSQIVAVGMEGNSASIH